MEPGRLTFEVKGPERIPAAYRIALPAGTRVTVTYRRMRNGAPVAAETRQDRDGTLYVRFPMSTGECGYRSAGDPPPFGE